MEGSRRHTRRRERIRADTPTPPPLILDACLIPLHQEIENKGGSSSHDRQYQLSSHKPVEQEEEDLHKKPREKQRKGRMK